MSKHTPEPWIAIDRAIKRDNGFGYGEIVANVPGGNTSGPFFVQSNEECEANARRIVACVNACAGLPTEWLEKNALTDCTSSHKLVKQCDELVAALRSAVETIEWMHGCSSPASDEVEDAIREGNATIAKAKGGAE